MKKASLASLASLVKIGTLVNTLVKASTVLASSLLFALKAAFQIAKKFQRATPEVLGSAVIKLTPSFSRSDQILMFLGLPSRTMIAGTDLETMPSLGNSFSQPASIKPAFSNLLVSAATARWTISASSPSMTARVWEPEPP